MTGNTTARAVADRVSRWREQAHRRHLDTGQTLPQHDELDAMSRRLAATAPADLLLLESEWLALEARLEAEHPLLATLVQESLRKLAAMGI